MDRELQNRLRKIIVDANWQSARSARYADAPHQYIIAHRSGPEWKVFADAIRMHGVYRTWKGHRYKYLILDNRCYWVDFPALNRAYVNTLDPLPAGWDHDPTQSEIKKREAELGGQNRTVHKSAKKK
jgi:hypothetical protein